MTQKYMKQIAIALDTIKEQQAETKVNADRDNLLYLMGFNDGVIEFALKLRDDTEREPSEVEIKAMSKEQNYLKGYSDGKSDALDKIRAEIIEEKDYAYADFEQYKVDYLGVDAEYVEDELPQDDFRYGMERALEIIDKYKTESEEV